MGFYLGIMSWEGLNLKTLPVVPYRSWAYVKPWVQTAKTHSILLRHIRDVIRDSLPSTKTALKPKPGLREGLGSFLR